MEYLFWVENQDSISERTVRCVRQDPDAYEYKMISPYKFNDVEFLQFEVQKKSDDQDENLELLLVDTEQQVHTIEMSLKRKAFDPNPDDPESIQKALHIEWLKLDLSEDPIDSVDAGKRLLRDFQDNQKCYSFVNENCIVLKLRDTVIYRQTKTDQTYLIYANKKEFKDWLNNY